jgi:hypothetical protein
MGVHEYTIDAETFSSLSSRLQELQRQSTPAESALLSMLLATAAEQIEGGSEHDTSGYNFRAGSSVQISNAASLSSGFSNSFGPLVPGLKQGGSFSPFVLKWMDSGAPPIGGGRL